MFSHFTRALSRHRSIEDPKRRGSGESRLEAAGPSASGGQPLVVVEDGSRHGDGSLSVPLLGGERLSPILEGRSGGGTPRGEPGSPSSGQERERNHHDHHHALPSGGEGHGEVACTFHLAKAILGVGVTALPYAFLLLGALPAMIAFMGGGLLTYYSCDCLVRGSLATGRTSYSGVMTKQLGTWAAVSLDLAMILNCFGMQVIYLIVVGDVLCPGASGPAAGDLLTGRWGQFLESRERVLGVVTFFVLAPLLSFRHMRRTTFVSLLGVSAIGVWAVATLAMGASVVVQQEGHAISLWPKWAWFSGGMGKALLRLTAVLPVIITAFMCQMSFFPIVHELRPCTGKGMRRAAGAAIAACFVLFCVLALSSQVLFGEKVEPNVLKNFTSTNVLKAVGGSSGAAFAVVWAVRVAYLMSILASFPLQMRPFRDSLAWMVGGEAVLAGPGGFYVVTYATLTLVYLTAIGLPSIWLPIQLVGATAGALVAFILPGLLVLNLSGRRGWGHKGVGRKAGALGGSLLVGIGGVAGIAGVVSALIQD